MNRVWETHRGDEWWYEDFWCKASAWRSAGIVSVGEIGAADSQVTEDRLHEFLWLSWQRFNDETILLSLSNSAIKSNLACLAQRGLVKYESFNSSYSKEAKILTVQPYIKEPIEKSAQKECWKFW